METLTLEMPIMYGDHHVIEVRRILLAIPGVKDVYASSAFQVTEVTYDPAETTPEEIKAKLEEAGYLGELPIPVEAGKAAYEGGKIGEPFMRHTEAFEQAKKVVGFKQQVSYSGRALWPCPGMEPIKGMDED